MVVISTLNLGKHSEEVIQVDTDILSIGFQNLKNIEIYRPLPQIFGGTSRSGRKVSLKNWKKINFRGLKEEISTPHFWKHSEKRIRTWY